MTSSTSLPAIEDLTPLARQINASHQKVLKAVNASLEHARDAGNLLMEARKKLEAAGQPWQRWVQENCKFSVSTAERYVRVADNFHKLTAEDIDLAGLSLTAALKLVAAKPQAGKGGPGGKAEPLTVASEEEVTRLSSKAAELELPADSAEKKFVQTKVAALARQVEAVARKSKLKDESGQALTPVQVALALIEQLRKALDVHLVVTVQEQSSQGDEAVAA